MSYFASLRKSLKLRRISKVLGRRLSSQQDDFLRATNGKDRAIKNLPELAADDAGIRDTMARYGIDRSALQEIYEMLLKAGAGQWVRGHWVAASAIVFVPTLEFILTKTGRHNVSSNNWLSVASRLVDYFQMGETGRINF
jgi:hypothetical protein